MSQKSPSGFFTSLIAEVVIVAAVVSLLPRVPLGRAAPVAPSDAADERPSLAPQFGQVPLPEPLPPPDGNWRTAVSRPAEGSFSLPPQSPHWKLPPRDLPPPDPAYVQQRLDQAGQQLLEGVSHYLSRQAHELLEPAASAQPQQAQSVRDVPAFQSWPR